METPPVDLQLLNADRKISAVSQPFIANTRNMIYARQTHNIYSVRNITQLLFQQNALVY
jgi:hypothetical protein